MIDSEKNADQTAKKGDSKAQELPSETKEAAVSALARVKELGIRAGCKAAVGLATGVAVGVGKHLGDVIVNDYFNGHN